MGKINDFELQIDERGQNREDALFMMSDEEKNDLQCLSLSPWKSIYTLHILTNISKIMYPSCFDTDLYKN